MSRYEYALAGWFLLALLVSLSGVMYGAPAPVIGAVNWTLVALVLLLIWRLRGLRDWVRSLDLKILITFHAARFVGFYFLWLHSLGRLPYAFAVPGGWGDILIAIAALLVVVFALPLRKMWQWRTVLAWNTIGLLDILLVIATGMRIGLQDMSQMIELTDFPLNLLPTFIVPLIIVTHILIFIRLRKSRRKLMSV